MDHIQCATPSIYPKFNPDNRKRNGKNGPFLINGHDLALLSNGDGDAQALVGAMWVRNELMLVWPTVPQAAMVGVCTLQRIYQALALTPEARLAAAMANAGRTWNALVTQTHL